jgi:hypothetical protein
MNQVSIPPLITLTRPSEWDECGSCNLNFYIKIKQFANDCIFKESYEVFRLHNENKITIFKNSSQKVEFPILFITSLPALCVLSCDSLLHRYKLFHNVNIIPTNDNYPHITLFNYTKKNITINPQQLLVHCRIVLTNHFL